MLVHRGAESNHPRSCSFACTNACWRVFNHRTLLRRKADQFSAFQVGLRMRLTVRDVAAGNDEPGYRQTRSSKPRGGQRSCTRRNQRPNFRRQSAQQFLCTGRSDYAFKVFYLASFDYAVLGFVVRVGQQFSNSREAGAAMCSRDGLFRTEAAFRGPSAPHASHGSSRINKYSIQIK